MIRGILLAAAVIGAALFVDGRAAAKPPAAAAPEASGCAGTPRADARGGGDPAPVRAVALRGGAAPKIAIIIDDLGYDLGAGHRALALPGGVTVAILPGAPYGRRLAQAANDGGLDILLHLPMQAYGDRAPSESLNLTLDMTRTRLAETVVAAFELVPFAIGVNNHRGSLITRHPGHMQWLMETLAERESPIFIDSYTTHESVALEIAAESGVAALKRDVFLDAEPTPAGIRRQFERLQRIASARGAAVAIGHPYPQTLAFLEAELPKLERRGFELVAISELVSNSSVRAHSKTR